MLLVPGSRLRRFEGRGVGRVRVHGREDGESDLCGSLLGDTGHAEVIRLSFDPKVVSFREILEVFFVIHDPTTLNRQGNDAGTQYRSAVFYHSAEQKSAAEQVIANLNSARIYEDPIVTEVAPASQFYVAEDYHQEYFRRNPAQPYCAFVVRPKVAKFRKHFLEKLKK